MAYLYETHLHTIEGSACSDTPGKEYIEHMKKIGYSGIIVTDHFFNGNSAVPRHLPWEEKVELYCKGYEHALEAAKGTAFKVFFGVEFAFTGDEYLLYGVDKKWLLDNPQIMDMTRKELHEAVRAVGGIMVQAHPYRERGYLSTIHLAPNDVDGVECFNAENPDWQNGLGYQYCLEHNFIMSGGSDIHHLTQKHMGAMSFPYKLETIQDYIKAFLAGDGTPVFTRDIDEEGFEFRPVAREKSLVEETQPHTLPVVIH
jgi:hypothetical protein